MLLYELLTVVIIGVGHFYLYTILDQIHIKPIYLILLSFLFSVITVTAISLTGLVELNVILLICIYVLVGWFVKRKEVSQTIYFVLISIIIYSVVKNILYILMINLLLISPINYYIWTPSLIHFISVTTLLIIIFLLRNKLRVVAETLPTSRLYLPTYILVVICTFLLVIINFPTVSILAQLNLLYREQLYIAILLMVITILFFVTINTYVSKKKLIKQHEQTMYEQLTEYVGKLEVMHDELATFRHDYLNILLSLEESIRNNDLQQVKQIYYQTVEPTSQMINHQQLELTKLSSIQIPELKSILSMKVLTAQRLQLTVNLDIPQTFSKVPMSMDQYIRVITILIDNAIEEAAKSQLKLLQISLFEVDQYSYFIIKNSISTSEINLEQLYSKEYSTKGTNRGYGLYSVKRILNHHPNVMLNTSILENMFTQELLITSYDQIKTV